MTESNTGLREDRSFPTAPDRITAGWLESKTGFELERIGVSRIGEGSGFAGSVYRVLLSHRNPSSDLPKSVIWKTVSGHRPTHFLLRRLGAYRAEAGFYSELSDILDVAPKTYFAGHDQASGAICVIMEDLSGLKPGDQIAGRSEEESAAVVVELARLHSRFWGQPADALGGWAPPFDAGERFFQRLHSRVWSKLSDGSGAVPPKLSEAALEMTEHVPEIKSRLGSAPTTLLHGDVRLDNIFFDSGSGGTKVRLIDWQAVRTGRGAYDLAYFLAGSLSADTRRRFQDSLIEKYCEELVAQGVSGYSLAECREDFRWALLDMVTFWGIISSTLDFQTGRGLQLSKLMLSRLWAAIEDSAALDLLG